MESVRLAAQTGNSGSVQLAFVEQDGNVHRNSTSSLPHSVSPLVRLTQNGQPGHVSAQLAQTPSLQFGVGPIGHEPHSSVPPHPSGAVPHCRPSSAQVFGTHTHWPPWHCPCGPQQIPSQQTLSQHWLFWQQGLPGEPQRLLQPPSSSLQTLAGGPQHDSPQLIVAGSPQHVPPAQPFAGSSQVTPLHVATWSTQR